MFDHEHIPHLFSTLSQRPELNRQPNTPKFIIFAIFAPNDTFRKTVEPSEIMKNEAKYAKYTQMSHKNIHFRLTFDHEHIPHLFSTPPQRPELTRQPHIQKV